MQIHRQHDECKGHHTRCYIVEVTIKISKGPLLAPLGPDFLVMGEMNREGLVNCPYTTEAYRYTCIASFPGLLLVEVVEGLV